MPFLQIICTWFDKIAIAWRCAVSSLRKLVKLKRRRQRQMHMAVGLIFNRIYMHEGISEFWQIVLSEVF